jgi:iron complex outermembrane receptor protein
MKINTDKKEKARILIALIVCANSAQAQLVGTEATGANASKPGESADQLAEIVVTAQRRAEDVQHAALAIDVVSPLSISLASATRATDLQNFVPALRISESGNAQQSLYLRSVGTLSAQSYSDPAVSFNVDGIALGRTSSMTGVMYDLNRVEVLKGPQGTLYGRNATGGAINIVPNQPKLGVTDGEVSITLGNYGEVHPEIYVNAALTDSSAARLAMTYTKHDGYQTDGTSDADDYAGRGQYLYQFTDDLSVRVAGDYAHDGGHNAGGTLMALQNPFTGSVTTSPYGRNVGNDDPRYSALLGNQYSFISGRFFGPIQGTLNTENKFWGFLTEITWHSPIGTLTILPAYRRSNLSGLGNTFGYSQIVEEQDGQSSLEMRLASDNSGLIRWIVGGYYFHESIDAIYQFNQQALAPVQDLNTGTLSKAGFARLTLAPIEDFRASAGLRYTDDRKTFDGTSRILVDVCTAAGPIPACPTAPLVPPASSFGSLVSQLQLFPIIPNALYGSALPGAANSVFPLIIKPINDSENFTKITWHAGLEYDLAKNSLLYANWDSGYHAGGFAFAQIKPTYAPEFLSAYSVGSKNRFLNSKLELNVEGFYWRYTNQQIPHGGTDTDGAYVFYTDNAGASTIKGGEMSLKYLISPHTVFSMDAQYLSAIYDNFTYRTPAGGTNGPPETGCSFNRTDATHYTVNCAGKTALQAPKWTGNISIQQSVDIRDYVLTGEISAHGQSSSVVGFEMVPTEVQNAYAEGDFSLTLAVSNARWSVVAFVNNFTDQRPYGSSYYNSVMGTFAASVGPPRTEGVRAAVKF